MANMICTDDDSFHQVNYEWVLCYGEVEECLIVTFDGTDIYGEKGVLYIKKSWQNRAITVIKRVDEVIKYDGEEVNWTVRIVELKGTGNSAQAKIEICYEEPPICPEPIVSITSVSNYTPESGEVVKFTGYAYAGVGQEVTLKQWKFSSPYESTIEDEPSRSWINDTDKPYDTTISLEVRNNCGGKTIATTIVTVQPAPKKTGIEIQISEDLNGKDLIAYKAIHTIGDLWWTGPAFIDGIIWNGGRCAWTQINSSKKYTVLVGDPCQEREAIDGVVPEHPEGCGGEFADGDHVIIIARNPGFDFRVYSSANIHTLSGSSFSVVYLDSTSGDVIDEAFTGKVCGWLGLESGTECDAFWAEFYDPIFVSNYLSIQATGEDMFGNEKELGWIDHAAFIASLIGSLPLLNIIPLGTVTKNILTATAEIVAKIGDLTGDALSKAGGSLADVCMNAPKAVQEMSAEALADFRAALVKVYGDVQGNKYVDDALGITGEFVERYHNILERFRLGQLTDVTQESGEILAHGQTDPEDILGLIDSFVDEGTLSEVTGKLIDDDATHSLGVMLNSVEGRRALLDVDDLPKYVEESSKIASEAAGKSNVVELMEIPSDIEELHFNFMPMADEFGETTSDALVEAVEALSNEPSGNWKTKAMQYIDGKVLGWLHKVKNNPTATVRFPDAKTRYAKWKGIFDDLEDYQKFTFYTMLAWGIYETTSWVGTYIIPKWFGFFPEQAAFRQRQHNDNMEAASWLCKSANDYMRWDVLEESVGLLRVAIAEAEEHLADNKVEFETGHVYEGFAQAITVAKLQLEIAEGWLEGGGGTGSLKCTSNEDFFYVEIAGAPAGFSYAGKSLMIDIVLAGDRNVKIYKEGSGECEQVIKITAGEMATFDCQMDTSCVLPVPTIDAPVDGVTMTAVQFKSTTTTESVVSWIEWDFGDGDDSRQQNPSHMFWRPGVYNVQLTVTDECGKATVAHTIVITGEGVDAGTPTPTDTPDPDLPAGTATVTVKRPINAKNGNKIVWPVDGFIYIDGQYSDEAAPHPFSFGGWKELPIGKHTFKIVAEGYQDESVEIDLKVGDEIDWIPYMDPVGYVPPDDTPIVDPPVTDPPVTGEYAIEFLIPPGATMVLTPITTVPHITVRSTFTDNMRRLSKR